MGQIKTLYEQVADQIIDEMLRGQLRPGEALNVDRQFFVKYRVNSNTAKNVIQQLVHVGVLIRDDSGVRVNSDPGALERFRQRALVDFVEALFERSGRYGLSRERVVRQVMIQGGCYGEAKG